MHRLRQPYRQSTLKVLVHDHGIILAGPIDEAKVRANDNAIVPTELGMLVPLLLVPPLATDEPQL